MSRVSGGSVDVMSVTSIRDLVTTFFSWWYRELEVLWRPLGALLRRKTPTLTLAVGDRDWVVRIEQEGRVQELGRVIAGSHPDMASRSFSTLVDRTKLRNPEPKILLPYRRTLRKILHMPSVTEPDLRQALYFEIDRQTPFQPNDVYFDYRILSRHPESKRLTVELITVPRAVVDEVLDQVHTWGLKPSGVDVLRSDGRDGIGVNLLAPDKEAGERPSSWQALPVLVFLILLATAFYIPLHQMSVMDESLAAQVAEEKETAKQTIAMQDELDQTIRATRFLDENKKKVPSTLHVLNELTKALPDDTWLLSLIQNGAEVKISGYSAAAAQLIPSLDAVPLFSKPAFTSPIFQDPHKNLERFEISFEITNGVETK